MRDPLKELRRKIGEPPVAKLLGRKIVSIDSATGTIEMHFRARRELGNTIGGIQGGILAAMLDSTMGPALRAVLAEDQFCPTLELKVSFLRPARVGTIIGFGRIRHRGRSVAFLEGELRNPAGEVLATASATARILRGRP